MLKVKLNGIKLNSNGAERLLLKECFFDIQPGKIYILTGANGAGKTTLALTLTGLIQSSCTASGAVFFNGTDILNCNAGELQAIRKKSIKYIFQDPVSAFDPLKKMEYYFNLTGAADFEAGELADYFLLPPLSEIKKLRPYQLSVGMAQRIAVILALLYHPSLIIMDEPNSALDLTSSNLLALKLKELKLKGTSSLIITQDSLFASKLGDEIAVIEDNRISPFIPAAQFFGERGNRQ